MTSIKKNVKLFTHSIVCAGTALLFMLFAFAAPGIVNAATPAGTVIKNQASASYRDADGVLRYTTSNIVETFIQQVAAVQLTQDQSRPVVAGRQVYLSHTVTNAGNGPDSFSLNLTNTGADNFDLTDLNIYADNDQNGQPDVFVPVVSTPVLGMHDSWSFVVAGKVPTGTPAASNAAVEVTASSTFDSLLFATNTDTVTVADGAVVEVFKSISANSGFSPGGPYTVTLSYRNVGTSNATDVTLIDALPAGMEYIADSARWSVTGGLLLTDGNSGDQQGSGPFITYCAYDASCGGLAEADSDIDSDSVNQVTAVVSVLEPGLSGVLAFDVTVASDLVASTLLNIAEFEYITNSAPVSRQTTNVVTFDVLHQPAVVLNGSLTQAIDNVAEPLVIATAAQGTAVSFEDTVWNTGNATDTFDLTFDRVTSTFPPGSIYRLLQSDGMTPLLDSNANGIPDTGPIAAGESYTVILQVLPPAGVTGDNTGAGYEVQLTAASSTDTSVSNQMLNHLLDISNASVDITNNAPFSEPDATGVGTGPESDSVNNYPVQPGETVAIDLYLNNTGQAPVSLDLAVSTSDDFSNIDLPEGWSVVFVLQGSDSAVTSTGVINPGAHQPVQALVSVPANALQGNTSLYFRILAEATGVYDIKHDRISVTAVQQVLLELDQNGQTSAGGSYVYSHTARNTGNVPINGITLSTTNNTAGWSSIVYADTNDNGSLDSADTAIDTIDTIGAGETRNLFVKVFAPASAATLTSNQTLVGISWNGGAGVAENTNTTTVADIEINIVKEQAPDYGCTGVADSAFGVGGFAVEPGNNCVSYRLTATNAGQATAFNVEIADATPAFTEYFGAALCSHSSCTIVEPSAGTQGNVVASIPALDAGAVVTLNFSVRVE